MKAYDIVGYTYQVDNWHPACLIESGVRSGELGPAARDMQVEDVLQMWAETQCIDRMDESSYDSEEFPKVIFADGVENGERCGHCGELLIGD